MPNLDQNDDSEAINRWWHWIRPYWHVLSFVAIMTAIAVTKWDSVQAYGITLVEHDKRISALEIWQASESQSDAVTRQEVHDIHERILGK